ncbi:GntR family transcriptional regulator [Gynuella sp.]|uniref:GntR family transcriptional regulator n=1 Tax=Gynuella sp. TaxID=2969146 RepID=UPI003D1474CC
MGLSKKELEIQRITDSITQAVAEQRLPPGTRLVEAQLVDNLKANRNHVRAALQRLALRHIVTIETNKGASIAQPSVEEARNIFMARTILERGIIEMLVQRLRKMDVTLLKKQIQQEQKAIMRGRREDIIRESGDFHLLLARLSGNPVLVDMLKNLITRSSLIISLYQKHNNPECGCDEHNNIIKTLESGNSHSAVQCMSQHLHDIEYSLNLDFWEHRKVDLNLVFNVEEENIDPE